MTSYALKRNASRERSEHSISFDLQFGFSAFYPMNEVNSRISGIVLLDYAIQDDCKYSTYTRLSIITNCLLLSIFLSYFETSAVKKVPRFTTELEDLVCLCNHDQNEKFPKFWIIKMSYRKFISQSTENRLRKLPCRRLMQLRNLLCKLARFPLLCKHLSLSKQTGEENCYYSWLTVFSLKTVGRRTNVWYCMDMAKFIQL